MIAVPSPSNVTVISKSSTTLTITWMSALIRTEVMLQNQVCLIVPLGLFVKLDI